MKLISIEHRDVQEIAVYQDDMLYPLSQISDFPDNLQEILDTGRFDELLELEFQPDNGLKPGEVRFIPLNTPRQVIGVGLNYRAHAADLDVSSPDEIPVLFFKSPNTYTHHNQNITIPRLSDKTTGEAEIGIVIKKECRNVDEDAWLDYVAGFISILDMTAEDLLRANTRYLGISKIFDRFLSMGSQLITFDEIKLDDIKVSTVLNGDVIASNTVSNMTFSPAKLLSFISSIIPLHAGDVISTGTPGAVHINHGDRLTCRIDNFIDLNNKVVDSKF